MMMGDGRTFFENNASSAHKISLNAKVPSTLTKKFFKASPTITKMTASAHPEVNEITVSH
jgi:hypothetical protein